ncbi:MAG TPA: beta-propeller fold lactonase family protein [Candidatus Deferrimicrobiaceae bacterium]|nr:beta-propeller fold lactonase family protein [Candidatus Deferrimicrobiaceae bacterium]
MFSLTRVFLTSVVAISVMLPASGIAQSNNSSRGGAVFAMTNAADKNEIIAYKRSTDGSLQEGGRFSTGGRGSGGTADPLGSQGSLTLSDDHSWLFAVNAGSGNISVFRVNGANLFLVDKVPCGGSEPVAVAQHGGLVYVVNAGGTSDVVGFLLSSSGHLKQIHGSLAYLSTGNSGPGSLAFSPDGQFLLVTEKTTNNIDAFHVQADGTLGPIVVNPSAEPGAFAVLFAPNGTALVVETGPTGGTNASAISSYTVLANGTISPVSASVPTLGAATCWHAVTPNGKFVYTSNSASATISGFTIGSTGALTPISGTIVGTNPSGSTNLDLAISADGKFLYTLNSGAGNISIFGINEDGTLTSLGDAGGLSEDAGMNGIAAI